MGLQGSEYSSDPNMVLTAQFGAPRPYSVPRHSPSICLCKLQANSGSCADRNGIQVLAENLPSGGSWYESILKNSFVVAMVKLSISSLLFPKAVNVLAQIQHNTIWHWHCGLIQTELSFILECKIEKSKVQLNCPRADINLTEMLPLSGKLVTLVRSGDCARGSYVCLLLL